MAGAGGPQRMGWRGVRRSDDKNRPQIGIERQKRRIKLSIIAN
jgi:hypothetical protein